MECVSFAIKKDSIRQKNIRGLTKAPTVLILRIKRGTVYESKSSI